MTITIQGGKETRSGKSRQRTAPKTKKSAPKSADAKQPVCDLCGAKSDKLAYERGNAACASCVAAAQKASAVPTLATATAGYIESLVKAGASTTTLRSYAAELRIAADELGENTPLAEITPEKVQAFNESKRVTRGRDGEPLSDLTIAKRRRCLRQCLAWAADAKLIPVAPLPA